MSVNTPPTENIPIFDPSVFPSASGTALTIASGSKYFLNYPVAQGSEIFPSNVTLQSTLTDASGDVGTAGQILSSTGTGTNWINNSSGINTYTELDTATFPTTLPIPTTANTYVYITGSTGGTLTIPTTGVTTGTLINFRNFTLFTINIAGSTYLPYSSISTTAASPYVLSAGCSATFYYNGSIWVQPNVDRTMLNFTVQNTCYASALSSDNINSAGSAVNLYTSLTTNPLYIGGGANTAVHTTGPIIIGSDSTASGGINIGTGTNQTVPTVNTVNIGSATYATNVLGTLTTSSTINASGNITAGAGSSLIAPTIRNGANTGSISSAGVLTGTSVVAPSLNASANTTDVGICTTQTSGVLNIGTGARLLTGSGGAINIGTGSGAVVNPINIGGSGSATTIGGKLTVNDNLTMGSNKTIFTTSGQQLRLGYANTQTSGSATSSFGPFIKSFGPITASGTTYDILFDGTDGLFPSSTDGCGGLFIIYLKNTTAGAKFATFTCSIAKRVGTTPFGALQIINTNALGWTAAPTLVSGTGGAIRISFNAADWTGTTISWMLMGSI